MSPSMDDLSTVPHSDVLDLLETRLGFRLHRERGRYSRFNGTAGFPSDTGAWVRLGWRRPGRPVPLSWTGFEAALAVDGVPRPRWEAAVAWHDPGRGVVWRAEVMTMAPDPVVCETATITDDPALPPQWWAELRAALRTLGRHETTRVCMSQSHLSSRISEVYGDDIDTTITDWACVHGDMGWANLTGPTLTLLDWESWGVGPAAYDAACLWAASLHVPGLAQKVREEFDDVLSTRTGRLCRLLLCANVVRSHRHGGRPGPLAEVMATAAEKLVAGLR